MRAESLTPITGVAEVLAPAVGGPWDHFEMTMCLIVTSAPNPVRRLLTLNRRRLAESPGCTTFSCSPVAPAPGNSSCPLSGLAADTEYNVTATAAMADGTKSSTSLVATFWTPSNE